MKAHKTQIKIDRSEACLLLFALEQLRPDLMGPKQKESQARLIKRLLKADERIMAAMFS